MPTNDPNRTTQPDRDKEKDMEIRGKKGEMMPDEAPEVEMDDDRDDDTEETRTPNVQGGRDATKSGQTSGANRPSDRSNPSESGGKQPSSGTPANNPSGAGGWRETAKTGSPSGSTPGSSQRAGQPGKGE